MDKRKITEAQVKKYLETPTGEEFMVKHLRGTLQKDLQQQINTMIENESIIIKMEDTLVDLTERLAQKKYDEFRSSYVKRNKVIDLDTNETVHSRRTKVESALNEDSIQETKIIRDGVSNPKDVFISEEDQHSIVRFTNDIARINEVKECMLENDVSYGTAINKVFKNDRYIREAILRYRTDKKLNRHMY